MVCFLKGGFKMFGKGQKRVSIRMTKGLYDVMREYQRTSFWTTNITVFIIAAVLHEIEDERRASNAENGCA